MTGQFRRAGLDVEFVDTAAVGRSAVDALLGGRVDACVTSVRSVLAPNRAGGASRRARFAAVVHQRSPIAAIVPVDSELEVPADLTGRRLAASNYGWFLAEFEAALAAAGAGAPALVGVPAHDAQSPLRRGEVDMLASWSELVPWARRRSGVEVRSIAVGPPVYTTGVAVADGLADELAARLAAAVSAALAQPDEAVVAGLPECRRRAPSVPVADVLEEWARLRPNVVAEGGPGTMDAGRWAATVEWAVKTAGAAPVALDDVCRAGLLPADYAVA